MRFLLIFSLFLLNKPLVAADKEGFHGCGLYQARGIGRSTIKGSTIVINEKSQSETILTLAPQGEASLAPYLDRALVANVKIEKLDGLRGAATIVSIQDRSPNPLNPNDTGLTFLSKADCK